MPASAIERRKLAREPSPQSFPGVNFEDELGGAVSQSYRSVQAGA